MLAPFADTGDVHSAHAGASSLGVVAYDAIQDGHPRYEVLVSGNVQEIGDEAVWVLEQKAYPIIS